MPCSDHFRRGGLGGLLLDALHVAQGHSFLQICKRAIQAQVPGGGEPSLSETRGQIFFFLNIRRFCGHLILPWVPPRALSEVEPSASLARDNPLAEATTSHTGSEPATLGNDVDVLPIMPSVAGSEC